MPSYKGKKLPRAEAETLAREFVKGLACSYTITCGSLRRSTPEVGDIDIVAVTDDGKLPVPAIQRAGVEWKSGGEKSQTYVIAGPQGPVQVNLLAIAPDRVGAMLLHATGSADFNERIRARAKARGMLLSQLGLFERTPDGKAGKLIAAATESEIFAALDMEPVPPSARGKTGEGAVLAVVTSKSDPGKRYAITGTKDNPRCSCVGFKYHGKCNHVDAVGRVLAGKADKRVHLGAQRADATSE